MKPVIKIEGVSKTYRIYNKPIDRLKQILFPNKKYYHEFTALHPITLDISPGETVGIIGRNGSGKSTLLQMIAGTLTPTSGDIEVNGRVAALLELGSGFNPEFTGRENVYLNASILGISKDEIDNRMDEILRFADIGDFIDQPVKTYSSGMYVRLAFAVSINVNPDILIVDEALAVGDGRFQLKCFEKIKAMKEAGTTILMVSHDLQTIRQLCDKVALIDKGRLLDFGSPNDVVNHYTKILFSNLSTPEVYETESASSQPEPSNKGFVGANSADNRASSTEYRYGNQMGLIERFAVLNRSGEDVRTITTCEEVTVKFQVKALRRVEKPIYAMTVKSIKGLEVYGSNTYFQNFEFRPLQEGETVEVSFRQQMRLIPGDYYISLGFVELVDGDIVPLDRRYDVIELKILPVAKDRSFGIANLQSEIRIDYIP
jgi:ABC-type polysaccharide/polyol phosphate transport system, ATPase component